MQSPPFPLLPRSSYVQIFSSTPYTQTPSASPTDTVVHSGTVEKEILATCRLQPPRIYCNLVLEERNALEDLSENVGII